MTGPAFATPGLYGLPPGVDFPQALVDGLVQRFDGHPPEALARTTLYVNTTRMARRVQTLFDDGPARFLPKIRLITDLGAEAAAGLPPAVPALRRRLELARLVSQLIAAQPDLAPPSAAFDLATSLTALMDEVQSEGVDPAAITGLDITDMSGHWARSLQFITLVADLAGTRAGAEMDPEARQRRVVAALIDAWRDAPPEDSIVIAGSTGSRGTTAMLMRAVAGMRAGAVVLPGLDRAMPDHVWQGMLAARDQDHPQYRLATMAQSLGLAPGDVPVWVETPPPSPARNAVISLALRPAPVTDSWRRDGPGLGALPPACDGMTLIEAEDPRAEALAIALRLRKVAEDGGRAALVSPDRMLTRRVAAALDRWGIVPDDSGGEPLRQTAVGRLIRHAAGLFGTRVGAEALLSCLKHPLTHREVGRNQHLLWVRELERDLRRHGPPFPDAATLRAWADRFADRHPDPDPRPWAEWVAACCLTHDAVGPAPLADHVARLTRTLTSLTCGHDGPAEPTALWDHTEGVEARRMLAELDAEACAGGTFDPPGFLSLLDSLMTGQVRDATLPDRRIMIWGTLEARVQGADLVILAGLNDGTWPEMPGADPWLNRQMRAQAGLLLPERRVGLSAHDFQQAVAAPEVILTRARREGGAETVPSRWLNRLTNLLSGLPDQDGPVALAAMRARGRHWLDMAAALDRPAAAVAPDPRPAPQPPVAHRPRVLSVTDIEKLARDPYHIYARKILGLSALDPLRRTPDARARGQVLHTVMEHAVPGLADVPVSDRRARFLSVAEAVLARDVPWPAARRLWLGRLARIAERFIAAEMARQADATPVAGERNGRLELPQADFTLTARADRIDAGADGRLRLYDYKGSRIPSEKSQKAFDKQLLLEALIAEEVGFTDIPPASVARAAYLGLAGALKEVDAPLEDLPPVRVRAELLKLIGAFDDPATGYPAKVSAESVKTESDFDHLSRLGEWDTSQAAQPGPVGQ